MSDDKGDENSGCVIKECLDEFLYTSLGHNDAEKLTDKINAYTDYLVKKFERPKIIIKKVEDLEVGDRIKIISTALLNKEPNLTGFAEITDITESKDDLKIWNEIHFEGFDKLSYYDVCLADYQTEYEVMPPRRGRVGTLSCDVSALPFREEDLRFLILLSALGDENGKNT